MTRPTNSNPHQTAADLRAEFPLLNQLVNGKALAYFDNAATTQKPQVVIDRLVKFYREDNANIHRGVHTLSQRSTEDYEAARATVADFIGAAKSSEVIFTRGATEAINLVAASYGDAFLKEGDVILLTEMEHHANIVPWQLLAKRKGLEILVAPVTDDAVLNLGATLRLIEERKPALVGIVHASNAVGVINPVEKIIAAAHAFGGKVLLDGSQSTAHFPVSVTVLGADFFVFSGHKVFGPTGIGVLYAREELLNAMPPYQGGGDMIEKVSFSGTSFRNAPERFEAGTPHISGAIGLAAALSFIKAQDFAALHAHEQKLLEQARHLLHKIPGMRILGGDSEKVSLVSFVLDGVHPHDIGSFLDAEGIAVRTGHHCAQPLMERLGLQGTTRASFAFYNTEEEVARLATGLERIAKFFR